MATYKAIPLMGSINFNVRTGLNQPSNPKENTIWVNTSVLSSKWSIDGKEPASPVVGQIWFCVANSNGLISFNALKTNQLDTNLTAAYQWNGAEWTTCDSYIYINGEWIMFDAAPIANAIETFSWVSGGTNPGIIENNQLKVSSTYGGGTHQTSYWVTEEKIDVTGFSKIIFHVAKYYHRTASSYVGISETNIFDSSVTSTLFVSYKNLDVDNNNVSNPSTTLTVNVENITGSYYIKIGMKDPNGWGSYLEIDRISLE